MHANIRRQVIDWLHAKYAQSTLPALALLRELLVMADGLETKKAPATGTRAYLVL